MSFARGFQVGWSAVDDALKEKEKRELREGLQRESARFTPTEVASGEEALRGFREGTAQTDTFYLQMVRAVLTVTPARKCI
jgi:hypothetical protein